MIAAENESYLAATCETSVPYMKFFRKKYLSVRLIDRDGVIRLQRKNGGVHCGKFRNLDAHIKRMIDEFTVYGDSGEEVPNLWIVNGSRLIDMSALQSREQILTLAKTELAGVDPDTDLIFIATKTTENARG